MIADILAEIDAEIARLQQARSLLSTLTGTGETPKRKRGRPAKSAPSKAAPAKKRKRTMSPEAREKIRQAQLARWAASKTKKKASK